MLEIEAKIFLCFIKFLGIFQVKFGDISASSIIGNIGNVDRLILSDEETN